MTKLKFKLLIITSIPAPYRTIVFDKINEELGENFCVFYCGKTGSNRKWGKTPLKHQHIFLKESIIRLKNRFMYWNIDIWRQLTKYNPEIIVTGGFNPTMLIAWIYSFIYRKNHLVNTDAWERTEIDMTIFHILIRKFFYRFADGFLPIGEKGKNNYLSYRVPVSKIFKFPYVIDNKYYLKFKNTKKKYDVMFSGQFIYRKMPFFFCDIVEELQKTKKNVKVLILGSGPLENAILKRLNKMKIDYDYHGFIQQNKLPYYYASSKLFLFPTKKDGWGVVANDACAVGTPVITCEDAGAAGDLIIHGYNGFILLPKVDLWVDHILLLLNNQDLYNTFSINAIKHIENFTVDIASKGIINAANFVMSNEQ